MVISMLDIVLARTEVIADQMDKLAQGKADYSYDEAVALKNELHKSQKMIAEFGLYNQLSPLAQIWMNVEVSVKRDNDPFNQGGDDELPY